MEVRWRSEVRRSTAVYGLCDRYIELALIIGDRVQKMEWTAPAQGRLPKERGGPRSRRRSIALRNRFTFAAFNILMPYPNTDFYRKLEREGRLLFDGKWWLHPEYRFNQAAFVPRRMSPEQLTEACNIARRKFNSIPSMLYRFSDVRTNLKSLMRAAIYWRYTTIFRSEVYKKHGMRFGMQK